MRNSRIIPLQVESNDENETVIDLIQAKHSSEPFQTGKCKHESEHLWLTDVSEVQRAAIKLISLEPKS
jgi:hypothetical protein